MKIKRRFRLDIKNELKFHRYVNDAANYSGRAFYKKKTRRQAAAPAVCYISLIIVILLYNWYVLGVHEIVTNAFVINSCYAQINQNVQKKVRKIDLKFEDKTLCYGKQK